MLYRRMGHVDHLIEVFSIIGSPRHLSKITDEFEKVLKIHGCNIPRKIRETVSRTLQDNCRDCQGWRRKHDLFYMPEGKGKGIWAVRPEEVDAYLAHRDYSRGGGQADVEPQDINRLAEEAIATNPDIIEEAKRRAAWRSNFGVRRVAGR